MSAMLVDSNVLLDVLTGDPAWSEWSEQALTAAADSHRLVINAIVYAEISVRFSQIEDLDDALPVVFIKREAIPFEAAFLAAKAFFTYRRRGGARSAPLPDFFIGAHAVAGYTLLTRGRARYRSYFPHQSLIVPPRSGVP